MVNDGLKQLMILCNIVGLFKNDVFKVFKDVGFFDSQIKVINDDFKIELNLVKVGVVDVVSLGVGMILILDQQVILMIVIGKLVVLNFKGMSVEEVNLVVGLSGFFILVECQVMFFVVLGMVFGQDLDYGVIVNRLMVIKVFVVVVLLVLEFICELLMNFVFFEELFLLLIVLVLLVLMIVVFMISLLLGC